MCGLAENSLADRPTSDVKSISQSLALYLESFTVKRGSFIGSTYSTRSRAPLIFHPSVYIKSLCVHLSIKHPDREEAQILLNQLHNIHKMATKKLNDDHVYTTDRFPDGFPQVEQPAIALLDWKGALNSIHQSVLSPQQKKKVKEGLLRVNKFAAQYNSYKIAKYTFGKIAKKQTTTKKQKVSMAFYLARAYIHLNEGVVFVDKHDPKDSNAKGIHRTRDPHLGFSGISLDDLFIKGKRIRPSLLSFFVGEQKVLPKGFKTKILNHMKDFDFGNEEQELKQLFHEVGVDWKGVILLYTECIMTSHLTRRIGRLLATLVKNPGMV